ncbi:MAG: hypothetical protein EZS28_016760 [Streblomastix strix]|uniref:Uncharacterized protein n=1 Tax=Streblomastix strix TaxID=222440 RepID=A0A5J4VYH5_9EUKA|nr:MAG: hypothetical protein EZS28_016760 [Streblomastix strix]
MDDFTILNHISPIIIQFAFNLQNEQIQSPLVVASSVELLHSLLSYNPLYAQKASKTPNLIKAIIILTSLQRRRNDIKITDNNNAVNIRRNALWCSGWLQYLCDQSIQRVLIQEEKYILALVQALGCGGGNEESNNGVIIRAMFAANNLYSLLWKGRDWCDRIPHLLKKAKEQMEEVGGVEESEVHLYQIVNGDNKQQSNSLMEKLILL